MDTHQQHYSADDEAANMKRVADVRFKQQIFTSVGGGMLFALVGVVTTSLLGGSLLGIAAVGALGLGCVYMAAKYVSQAVAIDQTTQAKKIAAVTRGRGVEHAAQPTVETQHHHGQPFGMGAAHANKHQPVAPDLDAPLAKTPDMPDTRISGPVSYESRGMGNATEQMARA